MKWIRLTQFHRCAIGFPETIWEYLVCCVHSKRHRTLFMRRCLLVRMKEREATHE